MKTLDNTQTAQLDAQIDTLFQQIGDLERQAVAIENKQISMQDLMAMRGEVFADLQEFFSDFRECFDEEATPVFSEYGLDQYVDAIKEHLLMTLANPLTQFDSAQHVASLAIEMLCWMEAHGLNYKRRLAK